MAEHEVNRLVDSANQDEDVSNELILRPRRLNEFQGQDALKDNLGVFLKAALDRSQPLDHVFISGPPGLGKTTLAGIIAHELGVEFRVTSAPALDKPKDLAGILTTLPERAVIFIDEIHRLKPAIEEMLYIAMEDYELDWVIGQGPAARTIRIPLPSFTLVGATTKPGRISSPLFTRFGIPLRLNFYSQKEIESVLERSAKVLKIPLTPQAKSLIATCSRGTPRVANRLLRRIRDFMQVSHKTEIDEELSRLALERLEIDHLGLDSQDRAILKNLIQMFQGGPVGVETLAITVGEGADSLEDFYEPYLIQQGFLQRTPRGRVATKLAYQHVGLEILWQEKTKSHEDDYQGNLF